MEVLAKRQRRRGQVRALSEATVAEVRRWNNCKQTISVKMLAGKIVGTQGAREGYLGRYRRIGKTFSDSSNGLQIRAKSKEARLKLHRRAS
jgi:hypothetical protein